MSGIFQLFLFTVIVCLIQFAFGCKPLFRGNSVTRKKIQDKSYTFNVSSFEKNFLDYCECGARPDKLARISGGKNSEKNEFPWQAALVYRNTRIPFCGGTLLNNFFVLTAAHCVVNMPKILQTVKSDNKSHPEDFLLENDFQVLLNAHSLTPFDNRTSVELFRRLALDFWELDDSDENLDFEEGTLRLDVEKRIFHPDFIKEYRKQGFDYDIALLKLRKPVIMSKTNAPVPICLPESSDFEDYENATAVTIGWGRTDFRDETSGSPILQKLAMPIYSLQECYAISGIQVSDRFICAGHQTKDRDIGKSDSGGPLLMQVSKNKWNQIGIVSWGAGEFDGHVASGFTRITAFLPWIYEQIFKTTESQDLNVLWCSENYSNDFSIQKDEILSNSISVDNSTLNN